MSVCVSCALTNIHTMMTYSGLNKWLDDTDSQPFFLEIDPSLELPQQQQHDDVDDIQSEPLGIWTSGEHRHRGHHASSHAHKHASRLPDITEMVVDAQSLNSTPGYVRLFLKLTVNVLSVLLTIVSSISKYLIRSP